ncbi:HAD hydrolase-like protein [Collinsella sp. zg1085]|uniref:HAD family hydrolase n=1 Tax=Collinsella sp. zg1085 TaxID=2844380 RepID=UPI001C0BE766|nr:HAD hydrolase-like protein [Collinsella sp. zg1085]QWT17208.1 HAD hydrolase-like protein [Collinsella sp. zg1085]
MQTSDIAQRPVVLFDFDGTVVDTQPAIIHVARLVLEEHGITNMSDADFLPMIGPPLEEGFELISGLSKAEAHTLAVEYRERFERDIAPRDISLFPGMQTLLDSLRSQGRRLAIATSRYEYTALDILNAHALTQFEAVCGRVDGIRNTKPASIAAALEALHSTSDEALMIGDRYHDVVGARACNMPCIGIYSGAAAAGELEAAGAYATVQNVHELSVLLGVASA